MSTTAEKEKPSPFTVEHPEYPKLLYNAKARTTAAATDKEHEEKLAAKGFGEDPYPPLPPDAMTDQDMLQLESLLHKMLNEISKYNKLHLNSSSASAADEDNSRAPARTDRPASRPPAR